MELGASQRRFSILELDLHTLQLNSFMAFISPAVCNTGRPTKKFSLHAFSRFAIFFSFTLFKMTAMAQAREDGTGRITVKDRRLDACPSRLGSATHCHLTRSGCVRASLIGRVLF